MRVKSRQQVTVEGEQGQPGMMMHLHGLVEWVHGAEGGDMPQRWATRKQRTSRTMYGGLLFAKRSHRLGIGYHSFPPSRDRTLRMAAGQGSDSRVPMGEP